MAWHRPDRRTARPTVSTWATLPATATAEHAAHPAAAGIALESSPFQSWEPGRHFVVAGAELFFQAVHHPLTHRAGSKLPRPPGWPGWPVIPPGAPVGPVRRHRTLNEPNNTEAARNPTFLATAIARSFREIFWGFRRRARRTTHSGAGCTAKPLNCCLLPSATTVAAPRLRPPMFCPPACPKSSNGLRISAEGGKASVAPRLAAPDANSELQTLPYRKFAKKTRSSLKVLTVSTNWRR